jgi:hypothetical protein
MVVAAAALVGGLGCGPSMDSNIEDILPQEDDCSDEAPPPDGEAAALLGTAEGEAWRALAEGEALRIIYGPQGGQHVYAAVKLWSPAVATWEHRFEVIQTPGYLPAGGAQIATKACSGAWTISRNIVVFLDHDKITAGFLRLQSAIVNDPESPALSAEASVTFTK